ncbi:signal peptidase I [Microbacterium sp. NPDC058345]|uniref:signal peptidase I n=1 Tax=Microbacterium sp. NPDC058345 TaxID=3346455 RepID=UPI003646FA04
MVSCAALTVVCVLAFFTVVMPLLLGAHSYTVLTGSMRPGLEPGTLIAARPTDPSEIRIGDIITFQLRSGQPEVATHRVVGVGVSGEGERIFTTRGDANNVNDAAPVLGVQVRGVLVYAMPWLGYINIWATPLTKSIVITVLGVGAIGWGVVALLRDASLRRRVQRAAPALAIVAAVAIALSVPPSAQAEEPETLLLSTDGDVWVAGPNLTLTDVSALFVPGDERTLELWIRNASDNPALLSVEPRWRATDLQSAADVALAAQLTARVDAPQRLSPDGAVRSTIDIGLPATAANPTRDGSAQLVVTVTLEQATTASNGGQDTRLPATGTTFPTVATVAAVMLIALGALLVFLRARRRRR